MLSKRSSQTCARAANKSLCLHNKPLIPRVRQAPQWSSHRSYNGHSHPTTSFWARNKGLVVSIGATGLCCGTYYCQWYAANREAGRNRPVSRFIERNFVDSEENIKQGRWWVMITNSFAHGSLLHLGVNVAALWSIVPLFVGQFGVPLFAGAWAFTALSGSAAQMYWQQIKEGGPRPAFAGISCGASGAICGFCGVSLCYMPRMRVALFIGPPMPLWFFELVFTAASVYCIKTDTLPGVGHAGHLGGTAAGIAYYYALLRPVLRRIGRI